MVADLHDGAWAAREGEATLVLPFSSFAQSLNNAASPQLSESALREAQARRRGADRSGSTSCRSTSASGSRR